MSRTKDVILEILLKDMGLEKKDLQPKFKMDRLEGMSISVGYENL